MGRIACLEGPSAVGKTTLAAALAQEASAVVVPELDAGGAPPPPDSARWFAERTAERWSRAASAAARAPLVVLDGDPLKGLWYNWIFASEGWPGVDVVGPLLRERVERGELALPDLYVVLAAPEAGLRARRADDAGRARRNFETHLRLVAPQRRWFAALGEVAPSRVLWLDTTEERMRRRLPGMVLAALERLPDAPPDSRHLLEHMIAWTASHVP